MNRLAAFAIVVALFVGAWFVWAAVEPKMRTPDNEAVIEAITESEPLLPYPEAVRVNLLINDLEPMLETQEGRSSKPSGIDLSPDQRAEFEKAFSKVTLNKQGNGEASVTACFLPHHFFRYYDAKGAKIGEISICFCCGNTEEKPLMLEPTPKSWASTDIKSIERFVRKLAFPTEVNCPKP